MKIGYARVSTENQNLERQIDALHEYGVDELYTEKMTGTKASRRNLTRCVCGCARATVWWWRAFPDLAAVRATC